MRVYNDTKKCILAKRATLAVRTIERMKGLLGRDDLEDDGGLVIEPCNSIHTFFMRFPIDVLFLDREGRIVRTYENLPPWRMTRIHTSAQCVVELPAGRLSDTGTTAGDRILLEQES